MDRAVGRRVVGSVVRAHPCPPFCHFSYFFFFFKDLTHGTTILRVRTTGTTILRVRTTILSVRLGFVSVRLVLERRNDDP